jgi:hypothetical protein
MDQPPKSNRKVRNALIVVVGVVVLALVAIGIAAAGGSSPEATPPPPSTFDVSGTFTVKAALGSEDVLQGGCFTDGGYTDIAPGTQVTVKDASGKVLALGNLGPGYTSELFGGETAVAGMAYKCGFDFSVSNIPEGQAFYAIEVAHRGDVRYERANLNVPLVLKLG